MAVKHATRTRPTVARATPEQTRGRNSQLRMRFPARPVEAGWPETIRTLEDTTRRLTSPPFVPDSPTTRAGRRRGVAGLLSWLSAIPGETWQQRWLGSGAEDHAGAGWVQLPLGWLRHHGNARDRTAEDLTSGLLDAPF